MSEHEIRILAKLRKWQKFWPWGRWFVLVVGLLSMAAGLWLMGQITARAGAGVMDVEVLELVWAGICSGTMFAGGVIFITVALAKWRGDPFSRLLLERLEREVQESKD